MMDGLLNYVRGLCVLIWKLPKHFAPSQFVLKDVAENMGTVENHILASAYMGTVVTTAQSQ